MASCTEAAVRGLEPSGDAGASRTCFAGSPQSGAPVRPKGASPHASRKRALQGERAFSSVRSTTSMWLRFYVVYVCTSLRLYIHDYLLSSQDALLRVFWGSDECSQPILKLLLSMSFTIKTRATAFITEWAYNSLRVL